MSLTQRPARALLLIFIIGSLALTIAPSVNASSPSSPPPQETNTAPGANGGHTYWVGFSRDPGGEYNNGYSGPWMGPDGYQGEVFEGAHRVYCKVVGRVVPSSGEWPYTDWWVLTDLDWVYPGRDGTRVYVSTYYMTTTTGNGNLPHNIRDVHGHIIPDCRYWVDTFANAKGYVYPERMDEAEGVLYAGTNYVYCKAHGKTVRKGSQFNHWWLETDLDKVYPNGYDPAFVSAFYLSRWGNDIARANNGDRIPICWPGP